MPRSAGGAAVCGGAATVVAGFKGLTRLSGLDMRIARVDASVRMAKRRAIARAR